MKIKTLIICACLIAFGSISCFAASDVSYDVSRGLVRVSGTSKSDGFVTIVVSRNGNEPADDTADENVIYKTVQANGSGRFDISITLPDFYTCGKYIVSSFDDKQLGRSVIGYIETSESPALFDGINSARDKSSVRDELNSLSEWLALDKAVLDMCSGNIAENILMRRPAAGYDAESFIKTYYLSEGIAQFVSDKIDFDELCVTYCAYTGVSYNNDWSALSDSMKSRTEQLMKKALASEYGDFAAMYEEMKQVAQLQGTASFGSLQNSFLQLASNYNVNLYDYYALRNDYYREEVFTKMYRTVKNACSMDEVISLFQSVVAEVKKSDKSESVTGVGSGSSGGGGGGSGGGVSVAASGSMVSMPNGNGIVNTIDTAAFNDISGHWAEKEILEMKNRGIIDGFEDGSFRPDAEITRAQFVKILSGAFQISESTGSIFSDVPTEEWYAGYVYGALEAGVINGVSDTEFAPETEITRQDAGVIIYRMLRFEVKTELAFADAAEIAPYAQEAIASLSHYGILNGYDGRFNPNGHLTRAEAAALLSRAAEYIAGGAVE